MKLIIIPPYSSPVREGAFIEHELVAAMRERGQLDGVEIDIDDGYATEWASEDRDEEFLAHIAIGAIKKVRQYSEMNRYDAIVYSGGLDPGFFAARMISKIPVAGAQHSAVHVASLIGDRIVVTCPTDAGCLIRRHLIQNQGLSDKVVSIRTPEYSTTFLTRFARKYRKEERIKLPEIRKVIDDVVRQFSAAVEEDRADTLVLGCPNLQIYEDEIRERLREVGYGEIQMVSELPAAVEMAKAMVNLRVTQAARAYPSNALKAKPRFR